jgi:hypothetical protein
VELLRYWYDFDLAVHTALVGSPKTIWLSDHMFGPTPCLALASEVSAS